MSEECRCVEVVRERKCASKEWRCVEVVRERRYASEECRCVVRRGNVWVKKGRSGGVWVVREKNVWWEGRCVEDGRDVYVLDHDPLTNISDDTMLPQQRTQAQRTQAQRTTFDATRKHPINHSLSHLTFPSHLIPQPPPHTHTSMQTHPHPHTHTHTPMQTPGLHWKQLGSCPLELASCNVRWLESWNPVGWVEQRRVRIGNMEGTRKREEGREWNLPCIYLVLDPLFPYTCSTHFPPPPPLIQAPPTSS